MLVDRFTAECGVLKIKEASGSLDIGRASAGLEIADDIRDSDRRIVEAAFNELIEWVVSLNFGDVVCPKFELFENEEAGTKERAERDNMLSGAGVKFTSQYWKRTYGLEDGDIVEEDAITPTAADFAEGWDGAETDAGLILDTLAPGSNKPYAAIHHLGGQAGRGKKVTIPARPYLPINGNSQLQNGADKRIIDIAIESLKAGL